MTKTYPQAFIFADEAGCTNFHRKRGASKYFILCTVTSPDCAVGTELLAIRRRLAWNGIHLEADQFHASEDPPEVREAVFNLLANRPLRVDATILEKSKAMPKIATSEGVFYKYAWYFHMKHLAPRVVADDGAVMVQAASLGTRARRGAFRKAIEEVMHQVRPRAKCRVTFWPSMTDPCLQIADYYAWAIQRAWERGERRWLDLVEPNIRTQFDLWSNGSKHYY